MLAYEEILHKPKESKMFLRIINRCNVEIVNFLGFMLIFN